MCTATSNETIHVFEKAGLGKAPFKFVGLQTTGDRAAINREREVNGLMYTTNHCTSCDYCGQAIHDAYQIVSADGKRFEVGCDCIRKTGDKGLLKIVADEVTKKRRARSKAKSAASNDELKSLVDNRRDEMANRPHPKGFDGKSLLDYAEWMYRMSGDAGRRRAIAEIKKHIGE